MFKIGDFVVTNTFEKYVLIVTRIYDDEYMAVGCFESFDGWLMEEYKVKQKYFSLVDLDLEEVKGLTFRNIQENLIHAGYFSRKENNEIVFNYSDYSKDGHLPELGLDTGLGYPITAID